MFDQILGLPVHVLVVHAVVVLGPLAALTAIAYAVRPGPRPNLRWWLVGFAVATGISSFVAGESGEALEHRLRDQGLVGTAAQLVHDHAEAGDVMKVVGLVFMVAVLVAVFWLLPVDREVAAARGVLGTVGKVVIVLLALFVLYQVVVTGHTGAVAAWTT